MRLALLQLNAVLGDPEQNGRAIEHAYATAVAGGAELVLTPELAVEGYLSEDRLWERVLRARIEAESRRLAALAGAVPLVLGTCTPAPSGRLWNERWWCEGGPVPPKHTGRQASVGRGGDRGGTAGSAQDHPDHAGRLGPSE